MLTERRERGLDLYPQSAHMGLPNSRSFGFSLGAAGNWTGDAGDRLGQIPQRVVGVVGS